MRKQAEETNMKYTGILGGSRTLDFQAFTAVLIAAEANLSFVKEYLGGHYGWIAFTLVAINVLLRFATKNGVGKKLFGKKHAV